MPDNLDNLLIEAASYLKEIGYWITRFNEVSSQVVSLGYNQMPEAENVCGYAKAESTAGSTMSLTPEGILEIANESPEPLHPNHVRELEYENRIAHPKPPTRKQILLGEKRRQIGERQGWVCVYCALVGTPELGPDGRMWHLDHFYAESNGGDSYPDNLVLSCATCNLKKSAALLSDFLRKMTPTNA